MIELLYLQCEGSTATVDTAYVTSSGDVHSRANVYSPSSAPGVVEVEIDETPRVRLPRELFPALVRRGDGWRDLQDVEMSDTSITGRFQLGLSRPTVEINRMNGEISVRGFNLLTGSDRFNGLCRRADPPTAPLF